MRTLCAMSLGQLTEPIIEIKFCHNEIPTLKPFDSSLLMLYAGCDKSPTGTKEKVSNDGSLIYRVSQFDNIHYPEDPKVQVTYKNLDGEVIVDSVKADWQKEFEYSYNTTPDSLKSFNAFLIVNYNGDRVPIDNELIAEESKSNMVNKKSFSIKLETTFKIKK